MTGRNLVATTSLRSTRTGAAMESVSSILPSSKEGNGGQGGGKGGNNPQPGDPCKSTAQPDNGAGMFCCIYRLAWV
jgi:hypothetical protein